jgi:hypothetical protein
MTCFEWGIYHHRCHHGGRSGSGSGSGGRDRDRDRGRGRCNCILVFISEFFQLELVSILEQDSSVASLQVHLQNLILIKFALLYKRMHVGKQDMGHVFIADLFSSL